MSNHRIVLATPHQRNDGLEQHLASHETINLMRLRTPDELTNEALESYDPSWVFFPHWSWRIPSEIHERFRCVIFHMTDLPYGRGGSPLQNLIVRGHSETVMSALRCVDEIDAGYVYLKRPLSLHGAAEEILLRASDLIGEMILEVLEHDPEPVEQEGTPTAFRRRRPEDGNIQHAHGDLRTVYDFIRMLDADGYPSAFLEACGMRFEFARASFKGGHIVADVRIEQRSATREEQDS